MIIGGSYTKHQRDQTNTHEVMSGQSSARWGRQCSRILMNETKIDIPRDRIGIFQIFIHG